MTETIKPPPNTKELASDRTTFVTTFGAVYEHSPWVAETVWADIAPSSTIELEKLKGAMRRAVDATSDAQKLDLIRQHPDLADPAAKVGQLSDMSNREQMGAGLTDTSDQESRRFADLNAAYKKKFGFPFVIAVRGMDRHQILAAFELRLANDIGQEMKTALDQIHRIASFRLADIFAE